MDREALETQLQRVFDADGRAASVVARQARDLSDAGLFVADLGHELTVDVVVSNLEDAPDGHSIIDRWNWWLSSLAVSHGGYEQFRVRPDAIDDK